MRKIIISVTSHALDPPPVTPSRTPPLERDVLFGRLLSEEVRWHWTPTGAEPVGQWVNGSEWSSILKTLELSTGLFFSSLRACSRPTASQARGLENPTNTDLRWLLSSKINTISSLNCQRIRILVIRTRRLLLEDIQCMIAHVSCI